MKRTCLLGFALLLGTAVHAQSVINMSHDLVARGIAGSNMAPDAPAQDSGPLLSAAIAYAQANSVKTLIADRGSYYFLSLANRQAHVLINQAVNLTIDFQNSDLYFKTSHRSAIWCAGCTGLTLQNFTVDYLALPFTQVTVVSVDTNQRTITYQPTPGYPLPTDFNVPRTPDGSDDLELFVFRNGVPIPETGRIPVTGPADPKFITLTKTSDPWATPAALSAIKPGDVVVYTDRGGPHAIHFDTTTNCSVRNVSIYASGSMGLTLPNSSGFVLDHVQVIPRPGTTRLISTNADGLHATFAGANNTFSNNIVRRTCDDALAFDAPYAATVSQASSGTVVSVQRYTSQTFPPGATVAFLDISTQAIVGTARIVSETPPYGQQTFTDGEAVSLVLDQPVAGLKQGFGMINMDPAQHGGGSVMVNNLVQDGVYSRGIWLAGVTNVSVHDNFVQRTSKTGIFVQAQGKGSLEGPSSNLSIKNNVVDQAIAYGGPSIGPIVTAASIHVVAENDQASQVSASPMTNIVVTGNRVTNSPRTAIRLENVNGGEITNNVVQGYGVAPTTNVYIIPACCETLAQYQSDFKSPVLTTATQAVTVSGNVTADASLLIANGSTASYSPKAAPASLALAYGSNLKGATSVTVTDSAGVTRDAAILFAGDQQVNYRLPDVLASGVATVTIGTHSGGMLIDAVAPGLYSKDGSGTGVAAATAASYSTDGTITPQTVFQCDATGAGCVAVPMSLGASTDQLAVTLYGTGLRRVSSLANVSATIGGHPAQVLFVGAQPQYEGLDQVNAIVPRSLAGAGEVPIVLTVDGQTANVVTISLK
jgi:uncharacterized protein (TIGR03437 family)